MIDAQDTSPNRNSLLDAQWRATLDVIPAHIWYASPSGALTFVNERTVDYLGLPKDHPLRVGIAVAAPWDSHLPFLHPDDREETRRVWSNCLRAGSASEVSYDVSKNSACWAEGSLLQFRSRRQQLWRFPEAEGAIRCKPGDKSKCHNLGGCWRATWLLQS